MGFFNWSAPVFHHLLDHRWRARDIDVLAELLRPYVPVRGALLDLGGGTGGLSIRMVKALDAHVTILDPTPEMISRAPRNPYLRTVLGSAEKIPFADDEFDAVLVSDAFHHFRDLESAVTEMVRVVRPGGGVVVLEIDPGGWRRLIVTAERLVGEPAHFFTQAEFCRFMAAQGVPGRCLQHDSLSYLYVGEVSRPQALGATGARTQATSADTLVTLGAQGEPPQHSSPRRVRS